MMNAVTDFEHLILSSSSLARIDLLTTTGLNFEVVPADIDERSIEKAAVGISPPELAKLLAGAKARHVAERHRGRVVIGADQVLELDGDVLHKPAYREAAIEHITRMAGRTHILHSAVAIARHDYPSDSFVCSAEMTVRQFDCEEIERYVVLAVEKGMLSSVGGYHFEGAGITLFSSVSGSHSAIMGLPLQETLKHLYLFVKKIQK